ncbi:Uma2 family endonuclease [Kineosporia babensis]|uniref:Uma2 family endonuclease n=1 Tax=Kineosporia babensis TaxID=499548 RepID=A0A9X1SUM3_9ACTN|nr:Uma2 family endonuclease [Kineosporia babensis]MCD5313122.1 Uma2 family endonuclease [Kineosporia babensis]
MSAEPIYRSDAKAENGAVADDREPVPLWLTPQGGFVATDLDHLPDLPPHAELIDGGLILMSPQRRFHSRAIDLLAAGLRHSCPDSLDVAREMSVILAERQRPEPDLSVVKISALGDGSETWYPAEAVVLAVEVVSPDSQVRDRERKPQLYAAAGIKHYWRVEEEQLAPVVYVYELDPASGAYVATGIYRDRLKVALPYEIDIELSGLGGSLRS